MKNQSTLTAEFWKDFSNYLGFAAYPAADLQPMTVINKSDGDEVLVFKTAIMRQEDLDLCAGPLDKLVGFNKWTLDMDDEDKVLRVVCPSNLHYQIKDIFKKRGLTCELMPY